MCCGDILNNFLTVFKSLITPSYIHYFYYFIVMYKWMTFLLHICNPWFYTTSVCANRINVTFLPYHYDTTATLLRCVPCLCNFQIRILKGSVILHFCLSIPCDYYR